MAVDIMMDDPTIMQDPFSGSGSGLVAPTTLVIKPKAITTTMRRMFKYLIDILGPSFERTLCLYYKRL
jgi:hypothetical protein